MGKIIPIIFVVFTLLLVAGCVWLLLFIIRALANSTTLGLFTGKEDGHEQPTPPEDYT
ncbi:MAG: hypothetical protein ACYDBB_16450 [Armatimonadota bacterium]